MFIRKHSEMIQEDMTNFNQSIRDSYVEGRDYSTFSSGDVVSIIGTPLCNN